MTTKRTPSRPFASHSSPSSIVRPPRHPAFGLLPPIFADCVGENRVGRSGERWLVDMPFIDSNHIYATDGIILVRTAATPQVAALIWAHQAIASESGSFLAVNNMFAEPPGGWEDEPTAFHVTPPRPCEPCKASGWLPDRQCRECRGSGEVTCFECGNDHECDSCDGVGRLPTGRCRDCDGTGCEFEEQCMVRLVGDIVISHRYAWLLKRHDASVYPPKEMGGRDSPNAVRFTVGEAEGLLKPLSKS